MQQRPPTIRQIAEAAGHSPATVSLALRGSPKVSAANRLRIQEIAKAMGYRPNPWVSALMTHVRAPSMPSSPTVLAFINAFPVQDCRSISAGYESYLKGASRRSEERGFRLDVFWAREPGMSAARLSDILTARGIHGVLVGPLPRARGHLSLDWSRFVACSLGYSMWRPHLHRVVSHHAHSIILTTRKLKRLGYKKIGFAMSRDFSERVDHLSLSNFLLYQYGIPEEWRIPPLLHETDGGLRQLSEWFLRYRPEVILSPHESVLEALDRLKIRVPEDAGFVNLDLDPRTMPYTGVNQQCEMIGSVAVDLLASLLGQNESGEPKYPKLIMLESEWVEGTTTRKLNTPVLI